MPRKLIRELEAAAFLGLSTKTLQRKRLAGEVPFIRISRSIRYDVAALQRYVDRHRHGEVTP